MRLQAAQRHGLIPRTEDANPMRWVRCKTTSDYEAIILTPEQAFGLVKGFPPLERTLTLLAAATGLRISECLGLDRKSTRLNSSHGSISSAVFCLKKETHR